MKYFADHCLWWKLAPRLILDEAEVEKVIPNTVRHDLANMQNVIATVKAKYFQYINPKKPDEDLLPSKEAQATQLRQANRKEARLKQGFPATRWSSGSST